MVSDAVCEFEVAIIDVAGNGQGFSEEVMKEDKDPEDAKEDSNVAEPDDPKSELVTTNDEATEAEAAVDTICELELAITEAVFKKDEELKEANDEDPNDAKEEEPAVVPCEPRALNDESVAVEKVAAVAVEAEILPAETPPLETWLDPEPPE